MRKPSKGDTNFLHSLRSRFESNQGQRSKTGFYRGAVLGFALLLLIEVAIVLIISLFGAMPGLSGQTPYWEVVRELLFGAWYIHFGAALLLGAVPFGLIGALITVWLLPTWRKSKTDRKKTR
jgi:hypothetical protein